MKKISIFLTDLGGGGAERVMVNLANGLVEKGFEVDFLLVSASGPYLGRLSQRIHLISFNSDRLALSVPKLVAYLKKERPDVLITALEDTNLAAIIAHRMARVSTRMVVTVHNNLTQEAKHLKTIKRRLVPYFIKWIYPFADLVVAVSHGVANDLKGLGIQPDKIKVIYNPIITPEFSHMAREASDHPWLKSEAIPVILGVGRLEHQKDFETLIKAFDVVRREVPARLIILGQGSQRQPLIDLAQSLNLSDDVSFPGFVGNPVAYMAQASVCVLSSAWEGFGNVLVESMGVGTAVVSTDCPSGPSEILEGGRYGRLVPVKNKQRLAEAIVETLKAPIQPSILQQRAEDFSLEKVLREYQKVLIN